MIMARPIRIEYPGAWYHVTSRGNERKNIFQDNRDRLKFLAILAENLERFQVELHGYVLMANHFHLLLRTREANLSHFMQRFNTTYTVNYDRRHHRQGHLFQGRYKALLVQADTYLLQLSRYLHLNPVRIKKNAGRPVDEKIRLLNEYHWSSFPGYVLLSKRQEFVTYGEILGMTGHGDCRTGRSQYRKFVQGPLQRDEDLTMWNNLKGQTVLGDELFVEWLYDRVVEKEKYDPKEQPGLRDFPGGPQTLAEIAREVAQAFGVDEEELYQRRAPCRQARAVFLELSSRYLGRKMRSAELGGKLGGITSAALCQNRKRLAARMHRNKSLQQMVDKIAAAWKRSLYESPHP